MWSANPIKRNERRQRASDTWYASHRAIEGGDIDVAIEVATRVKITDEAVTLAMGAIPRNFVVSDELRASIRRNLTDALIELGFEVEE